MELVGAIQIERDEAIAEQARLSALLGEAASELDDVRAEAARSLEEQTEIYQELSADHDEALRALQHVRRRAAHLERRQEVLLAGLRSARNGPAGAVAELNEIKKPAIFPLLDQYRRTVERYAPVGSVRRANYQRLVSRAGLPRWPPRPCPDRRALGFSTLPTSDEPEVSIVIPVYNNWELTVACLRSLAFDSSAVQYEVIVVDDAVQRRDRGVSPPVSAVSPSSG